MTAATGRPTPAIDLAYAEINALGGVAQTPTEEVLMAFLDQILAILEKHGGKDARIAAPEKIVTTYEHPPIPDRRFDWSAVLDGYDGSEGSRDPIGRGATEADAIADLRQQIEERQEDATIARLERRVAVLREACERAHTEMVFCRVFVTSREKVKHPEGTALYDETIAQIAAALADTEEQK